MAKVAVLLNFSYEGQRLDNDRSTFIREILDERSIDVGRGMSLLQVLLIS